MDNHLVADDALRTYLRAYEEYTTCHLELESQVRDGHLSLSRARRDLSARGATGTPTLGPMLFPREIEPLIVLSEEPAAHADEPATLSYVYCEEGAAVVKVDDDDDDDEEDAAAAAAVESEGDGDDPERSTLAALKRMGVDEAMQREIVAAVHDDGADVAMACGNSLAVEHGAAFQASSPISLSAGALDGLKRAQFLAALSGADDAEGDAAPRPKPQAKPSSVRDPLRWYALLPPPSLRQAQQSFRRVAETAAQCATAQARMQAARRRYVAARRALDGASASPEEPLERKELSAMDLRLAEDTERANERMRLRQAQRASAAARKED